MIVASVATCPGWLHTNYVKYTQVWQMGACQYSKHPQRWNHSYPLPGNIVSLKVWDFSCCWYANDLYWCVMYTHVLTHVHVLCATGNLIYVHSIKSAIANTIYKIHWYTLILCTRWWLRRFNHILPLYCTIHLCQYYWSWSVGFVARPFQLFSLVY